jgi:ferredoxin
VDFLEQGGADIEMGRPGWPKADPRTLATTAPGVFVAGDLAHGTRLLIDAVASGKAAARSVYRFLTGRELRPEQTIVPLVEHYYRRERGYEALRRVEPRTAQPGERLRDPKALVELCYSEQEAMREASRCLDCSVTPVFDGVRCVLCGGCADVCPTQCLKLVPLSALLPAEDLLAAIRGALGEADLEQNSAILKDEDRCIRCAACAMRCPTDAITMERVTFRTEWRTG